MNTKIEFSR